MSSFNTIKFYFYPNCKSFLTKYRAKNLLENFEKKKSNNTIKKDFYPNKKDF